MTNSDEMVSVDSGFDGDSVARAEWVWANLPTGRKWTSLAAHEKALVVHTLTALRTSKENPDG